MFFRPDILALMIPIVTILGVVFIVSLKILKGSPGQVSRNDSQEAQLIQEVYRGLQQMEQRIDALETILLERGRKAPDGGK